MDLSKRGNNADWVHSSHLASAVRIVFLNLTGLELSDISAKQTEAFILRMKRKIRLLLHIFPEKSQ